MTAPALVLLACGSTRPVASEVVRAMRAHIQSWHPSIRVHIAFADHEDPRIGCVVSRLYREGIDEIVFAPLNLANLFSVSPRLQEVITATEAQYPDVKLRLARPVGPESGLLNLVDARLREALSAANATELDALVLATEHSLDSRSRALVTRRARQWSAHHKLPAIAASDSVGAVVDQLRSQGRRHVAVGSLFLTPHEAYEQCRAQACAAGATAVAAPIGFAPAVCEMVFGRYTVAAMELIDFTPETTSDDADEPAAFAERHLHVVSA